MPPLESNLLPDAPASLPPLSSTRVLLVDDDPTCRVPLSQLLTHKGFSVTTAAGVSEALTLIGSNRFDVLVTDLHMPRAGDGLTVVSAMHHFHPSAVTLILSAFPAMDEAAAAILTQPDGILLKPIGAERLAQTIAERMRLKTLPSRTVESLADLLDHQSAAILEDWLRRLRLEPHIVSVPLEDAARRAGLPQMLRDLSFRLRYALPPGSRGLISIAAISYGRTRRAQGYTAAMLAEESRMLQASLFHIVGISLDRMDFDLLLPGLMALADEVASQLAQAMAGFSFDAE